jgi:transketolase
MSTAVRDSISFKSTRDAYGEALIELGRIKEDLIVMDADLSMSTRTCHFARMFPERFFNAGIAEQNMIGVACGLSMTGRTVVASTLAVFAPGRVYDQMRNTMAHSLCDVKVVSTHAGISVGKDGSSHQALEDIALARVIPGMTVIIPSDARETEEAVKYAVETRGPFYIRLGRAGVPVINKKGCFKPGRGNVLKEGSDVTLLGCGMMVFEMLKARKILESENISTRVVNMPTIKPIDRELIAACARETRKIFTCEEHSVIGGLGGAVMEALEDEDGWSVKRIGIKDSFGESGLPEELFRKYSLSGESIALAVKGNI